MKRGNNMKRLDIMCDIETLGNSPDSTIFQIAAIAFDINTGKAFETFNETADISRETNLKVTGSTLKWWLNTDKELLSTLLNKGTCDCKQLLIHFREWLVNLTNEYDVYLWGNGILFDNNMIQTQFNKLGLSYPVFYRNDRDMRTLVELASIKDGVASEKAFREKYKSTAYTEHDAYDDVKSQIDILIKARKIVLG